MARKFYAYCMTRLGIAKPLTVFSITSAMNKSVFDLSATAVKITKVIFVTFKCIQRKLTSRLMGAS
jgi:hypothetical protein